MKSLGSIALSLLIASLTATMIAEPTPSPGYEDWEPPSKGQTDGAKQPELFGGYKGPDALANALSTLSPAGAAILARQGYKFSIKNQAEMADSLRKAGFTRAKAKPTARGMKFVTGKTWFKGGLVAVSVYETYLQVEEVLNRPNTGVNPTRSDANITPAFRWRLGAAILGAIAFAVYCFLRWKRILR